MSYFSHFDEFLKSEMYRQHQVEVLTSGQVRLADLLLNESALFYFTEVSAYFTATIFCTT